MRQFLVFVLLTFMLCGRAQVPNVHMDNTQGVSFDLYNTLDSGKIVVLDFFAVNCGHCQVGTPTLNDYWVNLLKNGKLGWVWAIESSKVDNKEVDNFLTTYGGTYPGFSTMKNDSVLSYDFGYGIDYTPQYYLVKPDRSAELLNLEELRDSIVSYFSDTVGISNFVNCTLNVFYSEGKIHISSSTDLGIKYVEVYNYMGEKVCRCETSRIGTSKYLATFNSLFSGVCIVKIMNNEGVTRAKKIFITKF